jgi:hypothetical protein
MKELARISFLREMILSKLLREYHCLLRLIYVELAVKLDNIPLGLGSVGLLEGWNA